MNVEAFVMRSCKKVMALQLAVEPQPVDDTESPHDHVRAISGTIVRVRVGDSVGDVASLFLAPRQAIEAALSILRIALSHVELGQMADDLRRDVTEAFAKAHDIDKFLKKNVWDATGELPEWFSENPIGSQETLAQWSARYREHIKEMVEPKVSMAERRRLLNGGL